MAERPLGRSATVWRKSSYSVGNGACLEGRTSSHSSYNGSCVETAADSTVQVRDSTDPDGAVLTFSPAAWRAFTWTVRNAGPGDSRPEIISGHG